VQGAKNQVTGKGSPDRDFRGLEVANFADHDHVRVLAQNVAQAHGKGEADVRAHGDLVDALELVFDGFLDGDDALLHRVDAAEEGVK
jgi:hypothetical protein